MPARTSPTWKLVTRRLPTSWVWQITRRIRTPYFPAIQNPALIWLTLVLIVTLEFAAGLLAAKGAWDLWNARTSPAATFNAAKTFALLGCGTGIVVWLGLFTVFGGALFQMWDTAVGRQSLEGAFQFFGACAFIFLIVNIADD